MDDEEEFESMLSGAPAERKLTSEALYQPVDILDTDPITVLSADETVGVAVERMRADHTSAVMLVDGERLVGIFTERDLVKSVLGAGKDWADEWLRTHMTVRPECLEAHQEIWLALNLMHNGGYRHVPVVDAARRPVAIISVRDLVNYLAEFFPEEVLNLPPDPSAEPRSRYGG